MAVIIRSAAAPIATSTRGSDGAAAVSSLPPLRAMLPFGMGHVLLIAACYLDVMMAYFLLDGPALGVYAASAVLPKTLLTLTMPMLQVTYRVTLDAHARGDRSSGTLARGMAITLLVALVGAAVIALGSDILCGGPFGVRRCQPGPMTTMLLAILPFCALRLVLILQLARHRDWYPLALAPAVVAFVLLAPFGTVSIEGLADRFLIFGLASVVYYTAVSLAVYLWSSRRQPPLGPA